MSIIDVRAGYQNRLKTLANEMITKGLESFDEDMVRLEVIKDKCNCELYTVPGMVCSYCRERARIEGKYVK